MANVEVSRRLDVGRCIGTNVYGTYTPDIVYVLYSSTCGCERCLILNLKGQQGLVLCSDHLIIGVPLFCAPDVYPFSIEALVMNCKGFIAMY